MSTRNIKKLRSRNKIKTDFLILLVSRSNKNIQAQVVDNSRSKTLICVNSNNLEKGTKVEKSQEVGKRIAHFLSKEKIGQVVFDRNGYVYHGRVQALVDSVRNNNIVI